MIYVDTSVLVALHVREANSEAALRWFEGNRDAELIISDWSRLEYASALSRKMRTGRMTEAERRRAERAFAETVAQTMRSVPIAVAHFATAEWMVGHPETGLRAGDALHLAIAQANAASMATGDITLGAAAAFFRVDVSLIA